MNPDVIHDISQLLSIIAAIGGASYTLLRFPWASLRGPIADEVARQRIDAFDQRHKELVALTSDRITRNKLEFETLRREYVDTERKCTRAAEEFEYRAGQLTSQLADQAQSHEKHLQNLQEEHNKLVLARGGYSKS